MVSQCFPALHVPPFGKPQASSSCAQPSAWLAALGDSMPGFGRAPHLKDGGIGACATREYCCGPFVCRNAGEPVAAVDRPDATKPNAAGRELDHFVCGARGPASHLTTAPLYDRRVGSFRLKSGVCVRRHGDRGIVAEAVLLIKRGRPAAATAPATDQPTELPEPAERDRLGGCGLT